MRWDASRRLRSRQDELFTAIEELRASFSRLETEWADTRDQVRRSYQRLEKAAQRAERGSKGVDPSEQLDVSSGATLDPYSRKVLEIRRGRGAISPGTDESTG